MIPQMVTLPSWSHKASTSSSSALSMYLSTSTGLSGSTSTAFSMYRFRSASLHKHTHRQADECSWCKSRRGNGKEHQRHTLWCRITHSGDAEYYTDLHRSNFYLRDLVYFSIQHVHTTTKLHLTRCTLQDSRRYQKLQLQNSMLQAFRCTTGL